MVGILDLDDQADEGSALAAISSTVRPRQPVVLAHVSEQSGEVVDSAMARLGGRLLRRGIHEVQAEIAAADEVQRAAKREARKKLHAERRAQLSEEIHKKVEALKAKRHESGGFRARGT